MKYIYIYKKVNKLIYIYLYKVENIYICKILAVYIDKYLFLQLICQTAAAAAEDGSNSQQC